jgi:hypothetical protein
MHVRRLDSKHKLQLPITSDREIAMTPRLDALLAG